MIDLIPKGNGSSFEVGRYTYISSPNDWNKSSLDARYWNTGNKLTIGSFCSFADRISLFLGGNHNFDNISTFPFHIIDGSIPNRSIERSNGDIIIGNDVWIGSRVMVLSGVTIGDGACIGACSVVTKDIPAYQIWAGNPARLIRQRFVSGDIKMLLEIQWWSWDINKIKGAMQLLQSNDIDGLYDYWLRMKEGE